MCFLPCRTGHESNLVLRKGAFHVRLPWLQCQRQAPAEALVLKNVRNAWKMSGAQTDKGAGKSSGKSVGGAQSVSQVRGMCDSQDWEM